MFVKGFTSEVIWGGGVFLGECFDSSRGFYLGVKIRKVLKAVGI